MQFRLSVGQLPGWAQRQVHARPSIAQSFSTSAMEKVGAEKVGAEKVGGEKVGGEGVQEAEVEGRWAQVCVAMSYGVHVVHMYLCIVLHA